MTGRALAGFDVSTFTHDARTCDVYLAGFGPAVIVIHELPGIHPGMVEFARRLIGEGYTVWLPTLFGRPGQPITVPETVRSIGRVCASRELAILADHTNPAEHWLRALAARTHAECGGPGVGAIGMCFTGGFVLAMAVEPAVLAPVASQPGLSVLVTAQQRAALGMTQPISRGSGNVPRTACLRWAFRSVTTRAAQPSVSKRSGEPLVTRSSASRSTRRQAIRLASARGHTPC